MRPGQGRARKQPEAPPPVDAAAIAALFDRWADEEDAMGMEGLAALCEDCGVDPSSDVRLLIFCWRLDAKKPAMILREEWCEGLARIRLESFEAVKTCLLAQDPAALDQRDFRAFFKFVFLFSREGTHRTIEKDLIAALLPIAICGRSAHTENFLKFLEGSATTRVTLDQWCSFLEFSDKVGLDFAEYEEDGAWPLLLDEYVEQAKADKVV